MTRAEKKTILTQNYLITNNISIRILSCTYIIKRFRALIKMPKSGALPNIA